MLVSCAPTSTAVNNECDDNVAYTSRNFKDGTTAAHGTDAMNVA